MTDARSNRAVTSGQMSPLDDISDTLAAMRGRVEAATEGPWTVRRGGDFQDITFDGPDGATAACWDGSRQAPPNGEWIDSPNIDFIAHARTDVPRLLAALRAVVGMHRSIDGGMGYEPDDGSGYGAMDNVCAICGTSDEYAVKWPCPTITAINDALEGTS